MKTNSKEAISGWVAKRRITRLKEDSRLELVVDVSIFEQGYWLGARRYTAVEFINQLNSIQDSNFYVSALAGANQEPLKQAGIDVDARCYLPAKYFALPGDENIRMQLVLKRMKRAIKRFSQVTS